MVHEKQFVSDSYLDLFRMVCEITCVRIIRRYDILYLACSQNLMGSLPNLLHSIERNI